MTLQAIKDVGKADRGPRSGGSRRLECVDDGLGKLDRSTRMIVALGAMIEERGKSIDELGASHATFPLRSSGVAGKSETRRS